VAALPLCEIAPNRRASQCPTCEAREGQIASSVPGFIRAVFVRSRQASQDRWRQGLSHRSQARTKTRPASRFPTGHGGLSRRKLAIGSGAIAAARTMAARWCRSGS
jgi:hypothetical protein